MLSLLFAFALAFARDAEKTIDQYWKETGLKIEDLLIRDFMNPQVCRHSPKTFSGCFHAIATLADQLEPRLIFIPAKMARQELKREAQFSEHLQRHFVLAPAPPEFSLQPILDTPADLQKYKRRQTQLREALLQIYKQKHAISLERIFDALLDRVKPEQNEAQLMANSFNAYLRHAEDPHSAIMPRQLLADEIASNSIEFGGIGATLDKRRKEGVVIFDISTNSPAAKSDLQIDDEIISVNGQSLQNKTTDEAVKLIRGPKGSTVLLTIQRREQQLNFSLIRDTITFKVVQGKTLPENESAQWGFIRVAHFSSEKTCTDLKTEIHAFETKKVEGLIIDLRHNPGGLLDQVVCMVGLFVGKKAVVELKPIENLRKSTERDIRISEEEKITDLPLIVLTNGFSGSASEIFAGAIQDYKRGWVVGEISFGKGSVQTVTPFITLYTGPLKGQPDPNMPVVIKTTESLYHLPSGRTIQLVGVTPNFPVPAQPDLTPEQSFSPREADIFDTAILGHGPPWAETRPQETAALNDCANKIGKADTKFTLLKKQSSRFVDYQLLKAMDYLTCLETLPKASRSSLM